MGFCAIYETYVFFQAHQYCIEIIPGPNSGDSLSILKNDEYVGRTPAKRSFIKSHNQCFNSFDVENDILELKRGGDDGVEISVNLVNNGIISKLQFGRNADLDLIEIDSSHDACGESFESANAIRIQNGVIIKSACQTGLFYNIISNIFDNLSNICRSTKGYRSLHVE